ncbi:G-type lectin S-receptor-like serine/threonine-protein kinase At2g19130 [Typha angustifolia]|uniref:G-type lectin S-receptor-like serine/threonine-protein kinase At2g19130 n=1 Tax=Typha angustifolia TaxID=59011 RepID=UPI003C2C86D8
MAASSNPWRTLLFYFSVLILLFQPALLQETDTISSNQSLSGTQELISQGYQFTLGFFQTDNSSQNWYMGIWYRTVSQITSVWIANRENPIADPSFSELRISDDGNLVLLDQSKSVVWSTNANITSNSSVAVILDSGNLVLRDGYDSSKVFWQSINHPTNTWLPGAKLGFNKMSGVDQRLSSWKNLEDPAPGIFSLELDPNWTSQYVIQWNKTRDYWTSGAWNGKIFGLVPEMIAGAWNGQVSNSVQQMTGAYNYDFQFVNNSEESYFTYSVKDDSITSRLIMDISGQIKQLTWTEASQEWIQFWSQPKAQCDVYALCGPFGSCNENALPNCNCLKGFSERDASGWALSDHSGGCVRNSPLRCNIKHSGMKTGKDKFYTMDSVRLPDNSQSSDARTAEDCELACLSNCSCTAYSYASGCSLWYGDLLNLQDRYNGTGGGTLNLRLAASEFPSSKSNSGLVIGSAVGGTAAILTCLAVIFILVWRHRRQRLQRIPKTAGGALVAFRYSDLQLVTKNFAEKLGGGGFGSVFKGLLPDSTVIAVKKLDGLNQGEKQFRAEVSTIGIIQHLNLVRLLGFCSGGTNRLLVYEYMPNGSLDKQLFQNTPTVLDWNTRYQIALGIARGLVYLHEKCRDCIIHCDIKPENILLDASFIPKVADFGLAKLVGRDFSRVLTTLRGTIGYLAPEWITGVAITAKADVYSYGMMLFEIISGRRNTEQGEGGRASFFPTLAATKLMEGNLEGLLDPRLDGDANFEELERSCKVACWSIQDDESSSPTMGQIVQILEGFLEVNTPPIPRSLRALGESPDYINFFSDMSSNQSSPLRSDASTSSQAKSL